MLLICLLLTWTTIVPAFGADTPGAAQGKPHIAFGADGKFTILQIADIQDNESLSYLCKRSILYAVQQSDPDLIVLTGDNYAGYKCKTVEKSKQAIQEVMDLFESIGVPVAAVFGNHDDDQTPYTKLEQIQQYETYSCYVGCTGVTAEKKTDSGYTINAGTYNIPVYASADSDEVLFNVWCLDSGNYNPDPAYGGYSYVLPEQVAWYVETSNALREANGGVNVPSFAFQHIIPPQIYRALKETEKYVPGSVEHAGKYYMLPDGSDPKTSWLGEPPSCPNTACAEAYAELDAMIAQGDVLAMFVGHDHVNSYVIPYAGIDLVNTPAATFQSYNDLHRGFRVITVDKADTSTYETYLLSTDKLLRRGSLADGLLYSFRFLYDFAYAFFYHLWNKLQMVF